LSGRSAQSKPEQAEGGGKRGASSHLPTYANNDIQIRRIFAPIPGLRILHLLDDIHAVYHLAKNHMFSIEERGRYGSDEELRAVAVRTRVGHGKQARDVVLEGEVLVCEGLGAVDAGAARAVAVEEVATLAHEVFDLFRRNIVNQPFCVLKKGKGGGRTIRWNLLPL